MCMLIVLSVVSSNLALLYGDDDVQSFPRNVGLNASNCENNYAKTQIFQGIVRFPVTPDMHV